MRSISGPKKGAYLYERSQSNMSHDFTLFYAEPSMELTYLEMRYIEEVTLFATKTNP
jgi:hypothetical protein